MISLRKYGRKWHVYGDESLLDSWAKDVEHFPGKLIRKTGNGGIWQVSSDDKRTYFVKRERGFHFPFTKSAAEKEFLAFALLEEKFIPCIECCAWSATFDDSVIVTKPLPDKFCTLLKYWHTKPQSNLECLQNLCDFLTDTSRSGIFLPDLSMENLMTDGENFVIVNPVGAEEAEPTNTLDTEFLKSLEIAFEEVPVEQIAELLYKSGMFSSEKEAFSVLNAMKAGWDASMEELWKLIRPQLLMGSTRYTTSVKHGTLYRNSAWFTPVLQIPEDVLEVKELPESEASELWLESFHCQLQKKNCSEIPVIYEKKGDFVKLSLLKDKKYSFFYGFR